VSAQQAQTALNNFELAWDQLVDGIGFPEPFCDSATKYKVNVHVDPSFGFTGSGTGDRNPAMWVNPSGLNNMWVLAHEFTHTLQFATRGLRDSPYVGWMWESHANWMAHQLEQHRGNVNCADLLVNFPHLYYGSTRNRYCNFQFWEFLKDKHCYQAVHDIWANSPENTDASRRTEDPFSVLARNMGWSASELNDLFGEWALHNVTWDYRDPDGTDQGAVYRQRWTYSGTGLTGGNPAGNRRLRVTRLEELDLPNRRFAVPSYWAPQRWGYNLVRLHPDTTQDATVTVTFRGVVQDSPANTSFAPYTDTPSSVPNPDSDWRWGLVAVDAAGSPRYSSLQRGADGELCFQVDGTDAELWLVVVATPSTIQKIMWDQKYFTIYRYPWMVEFDGALPDGYQAGAPNASTDGSPHSNGGGWVASAASVATTAYVGPNAIVLGGTVSGNARIEDHAIVLGGSVSGQAIVGGLTLLPSGFQVADSARVRTVFQGPGTFDSGQAIRGTAQILGDIELRDQGLNLSQGVFYGYVDQAMSSQSQHGAAQSAAPLEVTAPGPYSWRP
jgi:hypothetical protein